MGGGKDCPARRDNWHFERYMRDAQPCKSQPVDGCDQAYGHIVRVLNAPVDFCPARLG